MASNAIKLARRVARPVRRALRTVFRPRPTRERIVAVLASGFFDEEWYLARYPEVAEFRYGALYHYMVYGSREERDPSPWFSTGWYLRAYGPERRLRMDPLSHYALVGKELGYQPLPPARLGPLPLRKRFPASTLVAPDVRVALSVHLFYADLTEELLNLALNIRGLQKIYATAATPQVVEVALEWAREHAFDGLVVELSPNRGRNVSSFTSVFGTALLEEADLMCHIHTKKSLHLGSEDRGWRGYALNNLLGSVEHVDAIIELFCSNERMGVLAPPSYPELGYHNFTWQSNESLGLSLGESLKIPLPRSGYLDFPAGCMFWARTQAIRQLLDGHIAIGDFQEEAGQKDGTLAHAIERSIYYIAEHNGYKWAETERVLGQFWENWACKNLWRYSLHAVRTSFMWRMGGSTCVSFGLFGSLLTSAGQPSSPIPRRAVVELMREAKRAGRRIIVVANCNLTTEQVRSVLIEHDIREPEAIYSTQEFESVESTWRAVLGRESTEPGKIVHIGSDEYYDVTVPGSLGVRCLHVMSEINMNLLAGLMDPDRNWKQGPPAIPIDPATVYNDPFQPIPGF